ncbi:MAG: winged helix-turn-helix transcriptional regulator [Candidatus Omnitrophica bacterium]|nr:winged helix-turn-helix transcriptional regulator [Candidatus Omnitrophota bacterium]
MKSATMVFKAFADEKRIRILKLLEKRKMCVCELAYVFGIAQPSVSKHIKKMMKAGLLASEKDGFWTNYFIKPDNQYAKKLVSVLSPWLNDDELVHSDYKKALRANREKLCCKK